VLGDEGGFAKRNTLWALRVTKELNTSKGEGVLVDVLVHGVDLSLVSLLGLRALELEGGSEEVVLNAERGGDKRDGSEGLKTADLVHLSNLVHVVQDHLVDGGVLDELGVVGGVLVLLILSPGSKHLKVWNDDSHEARLERVTVDPVLRDPLGLHEDVLELLWGDVLTKRNLEDVLGAGVRRQEVAINERD